MRPPSSTAPLRLLARTGAWLASYALARPPRYAFTDEQVAAFDSHFASANGRIKYDLPYPKREFLAYVACEKSVVLHGTTDPAIETLEPRAQTDWRGADATAVFATTDPLLATFFAVVDREAYHGSLRNGGFLVETPTGGVARRQYFSLQLEATDADPFSPGTVYVLPDDAFEPAAYEYVGFDEWYCDRPVEPLASLAVDPADFPAREFLASHREGESMAKSVLLYRWRRRRTDPTALAGCDG